MERLLLDEVASVMKALSARARGETFFLSEKSNNKVYEAIAVLLWIMVFSLQSLFTSTILLESGARLTKCKRPLKIPKNNQELSKEI